MSDALSLVMLARGRRPGPPWLQTMDRVLLAAARDTLSRAAGLFDRIVVGTPDREWGESLGDLGVELDLDPPGAPFHFGRRLADLVTRLDLERIVYTGTASAPLLTGDDLAAIAQAAREADSTVVANNIHSTDWAAIAPAKAVTGLPERLHTDSALGWVLSREAGLAPRLWPRSAASLLDLDTPIDALIAAQHPGAGEGLRAAAAASGWPRDRIDAARRIMATPAKRLTLIGRVPSWSMSLLEQNTQCWVRVFSEERGMRAAGRMAEDGVRSLVAHHLQAVGARRFFAELAEMTDAALIDSRVMMAAWGIWPDDAGRFASDLLMFDALGDPLLREFTRAAAECPIPILLGGHALVSAGLWAMLESMFLTAPGR
jgi:2-phospho-L-lactate guanylyltransferase (CobY/MobA/RfbA family)